MISLLKMRLEEWRQYRLFKSAPAEFKSIVFYSESESHWPHLAPIIESLIGEFSREVCYVTSSKKDFELRSRLKGVHAFYIGEGALRTIFFSNLAASVLVMTMPDLNTFHIKRSIIAKVHYVYVFHSIVSTHMIYREKAFDSYDTILTVGPHHDAEIRARESLYCLRPKTLVPHGSGRLDGMLAGERVALDMSSVEKRSDFRVLVAPSWGANGLLETKGEQLTEILLQNGFNVTVRPHPMTMRHCPGAIEILRRFEENKNFQLDIDISSNDSFYNSHVLISDWSGSAFEFAFALLRPVVFIQTAPKVNNPSFTKIGLEPIEVSLREQLGCVLPQNDIERLPQVLDYVLTSTNSFEESICLARSKVVHNLRSSGAIAANKINEIAVDSSNT